MPDGTCPGGLSVYMECPVAHKWKVRITGMSGSGQVPCRYFCWTCPLQSALAEVYRERASYPQVLLRHIVVPEYTSVCQTGAFTCHAGTPKASNFSSPHRRKSIGNGHPTHRYFRGT